MADKRLALPHHTHFFQKASASPPSFTCISIVCISRKIFPRMLKKYKFEGMCCIHSCCCMLMIQRGFFFTSLLFVFYDGFILSLIFSSTRNTSCTQSSSSEKMLVGNIVVNWRKLMTIYIVYTKLCWEICGRHTRLVV